MLKLLFTLIVSVMTCDLADASIVLREGNSVRIGNEEISCEGTPKSSSDPWRNWNQGAVPQVDPNDWWNSDPKTPNCMRIRLPKNSVSTYLYQCDGKLPSHW